MNRMQQQVTEFHRKFGHPVGETPDFRRAAFRARFILEEAIETVVACVGSEEAFKMLHAELETLASTPPKDPNFVDAIDGIGDSLYVQFGAAIEFGVDMEPIVDEIHRANMAKVGGATREDGKTLKPPGWMPPRIAEIIDAQRDD